MGDQALAERLRAASNLLEAIADDRSLLVAISAEDRARLLQAAGRVSRPGAPERRRLLKAKQRQRKSDRLQRDDSVLAETGIRSLRRKPVFTTPNIYPPPGFEQHEGPERTTPPRARGASSPQNAHETESCAPDFREVVEPQK